jgi:hypothetical protein
MIFFGIAYIGLIYYNLYLFGSSRDKAAKPKKVWNTSTLFPGLSPIPP